jgi:L-alanine-DL-glutamate epimerase-like enolase superfamily enzyme
VPIKSEIRNSYIDFSQMTVSVVALVTDVMRDGKPVVGFGFNSNGRYAPSGLLRDRFIPRLRAADPGTLVDESGENLDPFRVWDVVMRNEKPGGHGERSVAVGVLDMAVWDAVAKIAGLPLYRLLADRFRGGLFDDKVFVYAAGGYYYPDKGLPALQNEMQGYLDLGYSVVKMKIGGAPLAEDLRRIEAVLKLLKTPDQLAVDANGRFDLETARTRRHSRRTGCVGMRNRVIRWTISCKPNSRTIIRDQWRQEKTYFPCRTHEISFATRKCGRIAIFCSSIAR